MPSPWSSYTQASQSKREIQMPAKQANLPFGMFLSVMQKSSATEFAKLCIFFIYSKIQKEIWNQIKYLKTL